MEYTYLQTGRNAEALRVIEAVKSTPGVTSENIANNQAMFRAEYLEETRQLKEAATLEPEPSSFPMIQIQTLAARAIGEARTGD